MSVLKLSTDLRKEFLEKRKIFSDASETQAMILGIPLTKHLISMDNSLKEPSLTIFRKYQEAPSPWASWEAYDYHLEVESLLEGKYIKATGRNGLYRKSDLEAVLRPPCVWSSHVKNKASEYFLSEKDFPESERTGRQMKSGTRKICMKDVYRVAGIETDVPWASTTARILAELNNLRPSDFLTEERTGRRVKSGYIKITADDVRRKIMEVNELAFDRDILYD